MHLFLQTAARNDILVVAPGLLAGVYRLGAGLGSVHVAMNFRKLAGYTTVSQYVAGSLQYLNPTT